MNSQLNKKVSASLRANSRVRQPSATNRPTKKCYICHKLILVEKYNEHFEGCYRFGHNGQEGRIKMPSENATKGRKLRLQNAKKSSIKAQPSNNYNTSLQKQSTSNFNKSQIQQKNIITTAQINNSSILKKKGAIWQQGMVNPSIANRKYNHNTSRNTKKNTISNKKQQINPESEMFQKKNHQQSEQQAITTHRKCEVSNFRVQSRPNSSKRKLTAYNHQQNFQRQNFYDRQAAHINYLEATQLQGTSVHQRMGRMGREHKMIMSEQSEYQSEQLMKDSQQFYEYKDIIQKQQTSQEAQKKRIRNQVLEDIRKQKQRQMQKNQTKQIYRQRSLERQIQRQKQIEEERRRQRERVAQQERRRQFERQRQRERMAEQERRRQLRAIQQERRRRQREQQLERQRQAEREVNSSQNIQEAIEQNPRGRNSNEQVQQIIRNTEQIIEFLTNLQSDNPAVEVMVGQLRQLNIIMGQVRQLNLLGNLLGFRMGNIFIERVQQSQISIINQIGPILVNNFHNQIRQDFTALLSLRPEQPGRRRFLTKKQIQDNFPPKISLGVHECSICLEEATRGEHIKQLQCKHIFHPSCIDEWLVSSTNCPMCRQQQQIS